MSLFRLWDSIDHDRSLAPLVRTIAANRLVDHHRRPQAVLVDEMPDLCSAYDIEEHGHLRARLGQVAEAFRELSDRDRQVLLGEVGLHPPTSDRVARMRARRRLRAIMDSPGRLAAFIPASLRRFSEWLQSIAPAEVVGATAATGLLVVVSFAVLSLDLDVEARTRSTPEIGSTLTEHRPGFRFFKGQDPDEGVVSAPSTQPRISKAKSAHSATSTQQKDLVTDAGPARAEQGHGQGYVYVQVCLGEETQDPGDDHGVTVVVFDGGQNGEEEAPKCQYEE